MKKYLDDFRMNMKFYRSLKGWSQTSLAIQANSSIGMIGNIEAGIANPSLRNIMNIANALQIHPADLFLREASQFKEKDDFPELFELVKKLNSLPEIPRKSIIKMIEEMDELYGKEKKGKL